MAFKALDSTLRAVPHLKHLLAVWRVCNEGFMLLTTKKVFVTDAQFYVMY